MRIEANLATCLELLRYDAKAGKLYWRVRDVERFKSYENRDALHSCNQWNSRYAGHEAGTLRNGYIIISIFEVRYLAHRIIWFIETGEWPADPLDHVNGKRADNRKCNLREVTNAENMRNTKVFKNNTSGTIGVYKDSRNGHW